MLDRSFIPILVMNGDKDYITNWRGALKWTNAMRWNMDLLYRNAPYLPFFDEDKKYVGNFKTWGPLTFA